MISAWWLLLIPILGLLTLPFLSHSHDWEVVYYSPNWPMRAFRYGLLAVPEENEGWSVEGKLFYEQCTDCGEKQAYMEYRYKRKDIRPVVAKEQIKMVMEAEDDTIIREVNEER